MSDAIKSLGAKKTKKEDEKRYNEFIDDDYTFSLDEILGVLGPRKETI